MFRHCHPYEIFIPENASRLIVGTLPPPRFSLGRLKKEDVDFCYGSCDGLLWPLLERIYEVSFRYDNSRQAVRQRKDLLIREGIGICDIVACCMREKINASDLGMEDIELRDILCQLSTHPSLDTLLFTGGNSKNGPEYLFRRQLAERGLKLLCTDGELPRKHVFTLEGKTIRTISLISPSKAANRAIGSTRLYRQRRLADSNYSTFDYRLEQYRKIFLDSSQ